MNSSHRPVPREADARHDDALDRLVFHEAKVFKAGNSLAVRIPSTIAKAAELEEGSAVEMAVGEGHIWIRKGPSRELQELIKRITPDNLHGEYFNHLTGNERW